MKKLKTQKVPNRKLLQEYRNLQKSPLSGVFAAPSPEDATNWDAVIIGPVETVWEGGIFKLEIIFADDHPYSPPTSVLCKSQIFHPNIHPDDGTVCVDIYKNWSAELGVSGLLNSILSLLNDPFPGSPMNKQASDLYQSNRLEYNRRVRDSVELSWLEEDTMELVERTDFTDDDDNNHDEME